MIYDLIIGSAAIFMVFRMYTNHPVFGICKHFAIHPDCTTKDCPNSPDYTKSLGD